MSGISSYNAGLVAAYVPTEWVTGDTITADKLNHMENGIAAAGNCFILRYDSSEDRYISNEVYDSTKEYSSMYAIDPVNEYIFYGLNVNYTSDGFTCTVSDPTTDSIVSYLFTDDPNDETDTMYILTTYTASINFSENE